MTFQSINLGSAPNDGTGDDLRTAGGKINANFDALFDRVDLATTESAGLMSPEDKARLDGVAPGATANATNEQLRDRATHTGTQAIGTVNGLQAALDGKAATSHTHSDATTSAAGFMPAADKTKLNGIAPGATANATDAQLRDRATHTGSQAIGTVTGLQAALDGKAATTHTHSNATPSAAGFMSAADKVKLDAALTEITGEDLKAKAVPVAADEIVVFDSEDGQRPKLVPVSAFALASDLGDIRKILESI